MKWIQITDVIKWIAVCVAISMRHDTVCDMRTSDGGLSLLAGG